MKLLRLRLTQLCLAALLALPGWAAAPAMAQDDPAASADGDTIVDVVFEGLRRIRRVAVLPKIESKPGYPYSEELLDRDIKRLYAWDQFEDIAVVKDPVEPGKVKLIFQFVERKYVSSILFLGREKVPEEQLRDLLTTQQGAPLKSYTLIADVEAMRQKYLEKGFSLVTIEVQTVEDGYGAQVIFKITEGPKVRISRVSIHGNRAFSDRRLRGYMQNKKRVFIFRSGKFNYDNLVRDADNLTAYYRSQGFLDALVDIEDVTFNPEMKKAEIDMRVEEGEQYFVGAIRFEFSGDAPDLISERELRAGMRLFEGLPLLYDKMQADKDEIKTQYGALGRTFTTVNVELGYHEDSNVVDLTFKVNVGEEVYINRIEIRGNPKSKDKVIRRQLSIYPGERFNEAEFRTSISRLRAMDYFERISYDFYPSDSPGLYDLIVEVVEKETGRFSLGGGVSIDGGALGFVTYQQRNFDLMDWPRRWSDWLPGRAFVGGGQQMQIKLQLGTELSQMLFSFREPFLLDQPIGLNTAAGISRQGFIDSDILSTFMSIGVDRRFWRKMSLGVSASITRKDMHNVNHFAPPDIFEAKGVNWLHMISTEASYVDLDDFILPSRGWESNVRFDYAGGVLGGDHDYYRVTAGITRHMTMYENDEDQKHILSLSSRFGWMKEHGDSDEVLITERFFAGGLGSVRGFRFRQIGPRQFDVPVGGKVSWIATAEYTFPIPGAGDFLRGALFSDAGNIAADWGSFEFDEIRASAGFGFRVRVPFLGPAPVRLDFGFPILKEPGDETQMFNFGFESNF